LCKPWRTTTVLSKIRGVCQRVTHGIFSRLRSTGDDRRRLGLTLGGGAIESRPGSKGGSIEQSSATERTGRRGIRSPPAAAAGIGPSRQEAPKAQAGGRGAARAGRGLDGGPVSAHLPRQCGGG